MLIEKGNLLNELARITSPASQRASSMIKNSADTGIGATTDIN